MKNWIMFLKGDENLWDDEYFRRLDSYVNETHRKDFYGHFPKKNIYERPYHFVLYLGSEEKCSGENIVAYLHGHIMWDWMKIETIWVSEEHRRLGLASKLLQEAEILAHQQNLVGIEVKTWNKELRPLYQKSGFSIAYVLENHPAGYSNFVFIKKSTLPSNLRRLQDQSEGKD